MTGDFGKVGTKAHRLREWAYGALRAHEAAEDLPVSGRHLYYEAVAAGLIAKDGKDGGRRPDQDLADALTWLRDRGLVPWDAMEDRTRDVIDYRGWASALAAVRSTLNGLGLDPWTETLPVLVIESESTAGTLVGLASRWAVPVVPVRGQSAGFLRTKVARMLAGRPVTVLYVGDLDKSGVDIEDNTRNVLSEVCDLRAWRSVALTAEQVERFGLPVIVKVDKRTRPVRSWEAVECEALPVSVLRSEVEAALRSVPGWVDVQVRQAREAAAIDEALATVAL